MANQIPLRIRRIEDKEKKGSHGAWRRDFCTRYRALLQSNRESAYHALAESLSAKGEAVTCRIGCTYCCYHYVTVSLAQGIVIVDFLYNHKDLLKQFLDNYQKWLETGEPIARQIDRIRIPALASSMPIDDVIADTRPLSNRYFQSGVACPFLIDRKCAIYPVRPTSCSDHHAVSPPEWCAPDSQKEPAIRRSMASDEDFIKIVRLADARMTLYELSLPTMVYRLLTEGSTTIMNEIARMDFR